MKDRTIIVKLIFLEGEILHREICNDCLKLKFLNHFLTGSSIDACTPSDGKMMDASSH